LKPWTLVQGGVTIGDSLDVGFQAISEGIIKFPNTFFREIPYKCVMTTIPSLAGNSGSPILGSNGKIYGMLQFNYQSDTFSGGMNTKILKHVVKTLLSHWKKCDTIVYYKNAFPGFITAPYTADLRSKSNPNPLLIGEIIFNANIRDRKFVKDGVLLSVDSVPVSDTQLNEIIFSDILWNKEPGKTIVI